MIDKITLFIPYFESKSVIRQQEFIYCLRKNIQIESVVDIYLLIDDGKDPEVVDDKIKIINIDHRPTYRDWINYTDQLITSGISVLLNTDIYFEDSIVKIHEIFKQDPYGFVALSRYELSKDDLSLHTQPKWSQDVWAINSKLRISKELKSQLDFPLGVPRCDNKVAYLFSVFGHNIYNPCYFVKSIHVHESDIRTYSKNTDLTILGGTVWVDPSEALNSPSSLTLDIWSLSNNIYKELRQNTTFKYEKELPATTSKLKSNELHHRPSLLVYDDLWQFPAITELHAYRKMQEFYEIYKSTDVVYFAFPWATYIDHNLHNKKSKDVVNLLDSILGSAKEILAKYKRVVTVCQHIHMLKFQKLFDNAGITDVFWSHAIKNQNKMPENEIKIFPFPLYPVQAQQVSLEKKYLFSFVGAKAPSYYLTNSRNLILEHLVNKGGYVKGRETWHYNKVVYDHQIRGTEKNSQDLVNKDESEEFKDVLSKSVFSLCPSGTGPNSIRLWESIESGVVPVVLADTYQPPGSEELWQLATIICGENEAEIKELPNKLSLVHKNSLLLAEKRKAVSQLKMMYGKEYFVYDILKYMLDSATQIRINTEFNNNKTDVIKQITRLISDNDKTKEKLNLIRVNTLIMENMAYLKTTYPQTIATIELEFEDKLLNNGLSTAILGYLREKTC